MLQLGLTMAGCIAFGFFTGRWLDGWLGGGGIWTVLLLLFGIIGGGVVCYRQIMAAYMAGILGGSTAANGKLYFYPYSSASRNHVAKMTAKLVEHLESP